MTIKNIIGFPPKLTFIRTSDRLLIITIEDWHWLTVFQLGTVIMIFHTLAVLQDEHVYHDQYWQMIDNNVSKFQFHFFWEKSKIDMNWH